MSGYEKKIIAEYNQGATPAELKAQYNLNDDDLGKIKELNAQITQELVGDNTEQPSLEEQTLTLDNGTKVSAIKVNTVNQPKGGFINVYLAQGGKEYYQYTDENGNQQKVTESWDYLSATADNIQVAWNKLQDGHPIESLMTLLQGAENPYEMQTGYAPAVGLAGNGGGFLKSMKDFGKWLKKLKNIKSFKQFKSFAMNLFKGTKTTVAHSVEQVTKTEATGSVTAKTINDALETTLTELSNQGFNFTNVKGAIKATRTKWGNTTTSFINPKNGQIVKTVQQGNSGHLVTQAQKGGSYIHEYTCGGGGSSAVIRYSGYSAEGVPLATAQQSIEIIETNLRTGKSITRTLNHEQISKGLSYSERFNEATLKATQKYGMNMQQASAASMPMQDSQAISFLTPRNCTSSWGTPDFNDLLFVCQ